MLKYFKLITPLQYLSWAAVFFVTYYFMHGADHLLEMTPEAMGKYFNYKWIIITHITAGGGALILGPIQFWKRIRIQFPKIHKTVGFLYLAAICVSSFDALILSLTTAYEVNWATAFSLQVWVSVWIISTFIAYRAVWKKKFQLHQEWMVRSYLTTVAFIISGLVYRYMLKIEFDTIENFSPSLFWMGWSVPLFLYQVYLSTTAKR